MSDKISSEEVLEAIQSLHDKEQVVTRETLHAVLRGCSLRDIDNRIDWLVDSGKVIRVQRGVYVPADQHRPARAISKTLLPGGLVKIEIGDDVFTLTPREDRMLADLMSSAAAQFSMIQLGHQTTYVTSKLQDEIRELKKQMKAINEAKEKDQLDLKV